MSQEITPNVGLIIDNNLTTTAKQNLRKIDNAFASNSLIQDEDVILNSDKDILLQPGRDEDSATQSIYLGTVTYPADTVYVKATTLNLTDVAVVGYTPMGIVNAQIAAAAAIEMSKISGLLAALSATATPSDISDAISAHNMAYTHSDIAHANRLALDFVTGTNTGDEDTSSIKTKLGAASAITDGYLTSVDWGTFDGKEEAGAGAAAVAGHEMAYAHTEISLVRISAADTTAGYLNGKLTAGTGISLTIGSPAGDETLAIANTDTGTSAVSAHNLAYNHDNFLDSTGDTMTGQLVLDNQGVVFNITDDYVGTPSEGTVWWNKDDHTLNVQGDVAGSTLQVGQENCLRAKNDTAAIIPEGAVVYINGANTNRATVALADATDGLKSDRVIGIATSSIAVGALGIITTFGLVRNLTTNVDGDGVALSDGDCIYLSATTPGEWVKTKPHAPNHCVKIGQIVNAGAGGSGNIFVAVHTGTHIADLHDVNIETLLANRDTLEYDSVLGYWKNRADITQYTLEKTGFVDPHGVGVAYDSAARTVTLTHTTEIIYLYKNKKISLGTSYVTTAHSSTLDKKYFLYFDESGVGKWQDSFPGFDNGAYAAQINYYTLYKFGIRECHGLMDWQVWEWFHRNQGTYKRSGGAVTGIVIDSSTSLDNLRPAVAESIIVDEDLPSTLAALADNGTYMRLHFDTGVAVFTSDINIFPQNGTDMQYNQNPISGTALTAMPTNNRWANVYCCAVPVTSDAASQAFRYIWFLGQVLHTSLAAAQAETFNSLYTGDLTTSILPEIVPISQITFKRTTSAGTTYNVQVDVAPTAITGTRSSLVSVSGAIPTSHAGLLDRSLADQHPASAITNTPSGIVTATDVQSAINFLGSRYTAALAWAGSAGAYTMSIAGATHLRGTDPLVRVRKLISGSTYEVVITEVTIDDSNGNVIIGSTENFTGKVVIL